MAKRDLVAAVTVALVGLPQCLAYAMMSGLPPAYGLATAAVPGFVAALVGKSPLVTGPTNTTGLLILAALAPFLGEDGLLEPSGLGALATLTLMAGAIRLAAAYAGGAALVDFIPESVLAGFTAGAGILIAVMQLDEALGLDGVRAANFVDAVRGVAAGLAGGAVAVPAAVVTVATVALMLVGQRLRPRWPVALLAVLAATIVVLLFDLSAASGLPIVGDRSPVPSGWPPGAWPRLDPALLGDFAGPAAAIALLGTMELAVSSRRGGARPDMRREIIGQGFANLAGAFTSAFPASASLTRSALLQLGGARTRLAPAAAAVVVVPILFFGGPLVAALPLASLAGVLFVTALGMVDLPRMQRMWAASSITRHLLVVTLVATLVLPLEWAIFLGVGLGLAQHLAAGRSPRVQLLELADGRLVPAGPDTASSIVVLEVSGDCHFAAAGRLLDLALAAIPEQVTHVVIDVSHARALRFAALLAFERLNDEVKSRGGELHLAGVDPAFARMLASTGSCLEFARHDPEPLASLRRVLDRLETPRDRPTPSE